MTFKETYNILINEIQKLFIEHIQEIVSLNWKSYPQEKIGKNTANVTYQRLLGAGIQ